MYNNLLLYSYIPLLKLNTRNLFFPFMTISSSFLLVFGYLSSRYTFSTCVVNISSLPSLALFSSFLWLLQLTCSYMVGIISSIFWILTELFKKLNLFFESFNRTKGFSFISTSGIIFVWYILVVIFYNSRQNYNNISCLSLSWLYSRYVLSLLGFLLKLISSFAVHILPLSTLILLLLKMSQLIMSWSV